LAVTPTLQFTHHSIIEAVAGMKIRVGIEGDVAKGITATTIATELLTAEAFKWADLTLA